MGGLKNLDLQQRLVGDWGVGLKLAVRGDAFNRALDKEKLKTMRHVGGYGRKTMKSRAVLGKRAPKEPKSRKYKRDGSLTKPWENYHRKIRAHKGQPPYTDRGTLKKLVFYHATEDNVIVGPLKFVTWRVRSTKGAGAALLNEGGSARVFMKGADGTYSHEPRTYASFPYVTPARDATIPFWRKKMTEFELPGSK